MFLILAVSLLIGESFPFSRFRMYSSITPTTDYLYVSDGADRPVPLVVEFGIRTSLVKKQFKQVLAGIADDEEEPTTPEEAAAGERVLRYLLDNRKPESSEPTDYERLKLWKVVVSAGDAAIERTPRLLAELETP